MKQHVPTLNTMLRCTDYKIGWVCALPRELAAATAMLDVVHDRPCDLPWQPRVDHNQYSFGRIGSHNIVLAVLPFGIYGTTQAAIATKMMGNAFPGLIFVLMVGIAGGVPGPTHDIRLGDVVVSRPVAGHSGVLQFDFGKTGQGGEVTPTGVLNHSPLEALAALSAVETRYMMMGGTLKDVISSALLRHPRMRGMFSHPGVRNDVLYQTDYDHVPGIQCGSCSQARIKRRQPRRTTEPKIHYGLIGSGNQVIKSGRFREQLRQKHDILCLEMESAGIMDTFPCVVIRGISDYADSHKNDLWQGYAAITAAAYARDLLLSMGAPAMSAPRQRRLSVSERTAYPSRSYNPEPRPPRARVAEVRSNQQRGDSRSRNEHSKRLLQGARNGDMPLVRGSLQRGGDPNTVDRESNLTALHYTAQAGHDDIARLLLEAGANPNILARGTNTTPLFEAALKGHSKVIQCLLEHGAKVTSRGKSKETALHLAAEQGHLACVIVLLKNQADPDCTDQYGYTPLDCAESRGHLEVAASLRPKHATVFDQ
ncbi:nucleoside phosphorylase domain-containing protein [Aspergillus bertholletiae]|uniref:Nucleoside phosphorylase domain-containing protein n=1 Tax=Aspergillus bertholletiae TaxID=1226010 RepID=A0A5N7B940_9EURO|nr:nucleoside phosphorylase domain-containing protein [Aspergillus bertholletiae]